MDVPRSTRPGRDGRSVAIPEELRAALALDAKAWAVFDAMPPSHQRETVGYVAEAKQAATRTRRAERVVADIHAGRIGG